MKRLNRHGFLTINSQPRVNGLPSHHRVHGWGPGGGYVYQKAYVEFLCSPGHFAALEVELARRPAVTYHAVNRAGVSRSNHNGGVTALTWGVFPGKEIVQPTIVDPHVFQNHWAEECFNLWRTRWIDFVEEGSASRLFLEKCYNTYWLVNLVDNDFVQGDIFSIFSDVIDRDWPFPDVPAPVPAEKKK